MNNKITKELSFLNKLLTNNVFYKKIYNLYGYEKGIYQAGIDMKNEELYIVLQVFKDIIAEECVLIHNKKKVKLKIQKALPFLWIKKGLTYDNKK